MRLNQKPLSEMLVDPDAIGTPLVVGLLDEFGTEMFEWEPETLQHEIQATWKVQVPQVNKDKIWALITVLTTDMFTFSLDAFIHVCNALIGSGADFQNYDPADVQEMAWAVSEITMLNPLEKGESFSDEIKTYMAERLLLEGFSAPPRILAQFVQVPDNTERNNEALALDGVEVKSYWDNQQLKRLEVDRFVQERLYEMIQAIGRLPLQNADSESVKSLLERAETTLGAQSGAISKAQESVAPRPSL